MPSNNPVQRRLDLVQDQWTQFASNSQARLLRWVVAPDEVAMVAALWAKENDERAAETPDLLLRLRSGFEDAERHGFALRREFLQELMRAQEALGEESRRPRWTCPAPMVGASDAQALVAALEAFRAAHAPARGVVGVWLDPEELADDGLYSAWLQRLAAAAPAGCRFVVLEELGHPAFEALASAEPELVRSEVADLDMAAAVEEISGQNEDLETPGGQYRQLFVQLSSAAKGEDIARARALADRAAALAQEQKWPALAAAAHMVLGGVLASREPQEARARYGRAEVLAEKGAAEGGDPQCVSIRLHARMASGSVLVSTGAFAEAASWYRETVPIAEAAKDARTLVDCWRLASYCHEQSGALEEAWEAGLAGFRVGRGLDAEAKMTSSLSYLAEGLMRLTSKRPLRGYAKAMEEQIVAALGRDWQPGMVRSAQAASGGA
jgi:hypothetical protein